MTDVVNQIDGQVQVIFTRGEGGMAYCDALWMLQSVYDKTPAETIEAMKDERYTKWLAIVNAAPSESAEPTVDTPTIQE
jgi:hypothetical protein